MGVYHGVEEESAAELRAAVEQHPGGIGKQIHAKTTIKLQPSTEYVFILYPSKTPLSVATRISH